MNNLKKAIALCLALLVCLTFPIGVSAAVRDGDSDNQSDLGNGQTSYGSPTATATSRMWSSSSITTPTTTLSRPS